MPACALAAQRRKRLIVLVPMNGRIKPAMTCDESRRILHRHTGLYPSFPRRRESRWWMWGDNQANPTDRIPSPLMGEESKVRVNKTTPTDPDRHTGFKAVSTGLGDNQDNPTIIPLSLDGRGIKGEGETRQYQPPRPVILALRQYPQGWATIKTTQPSFPSPLMGEESKVRVKQDNTNHTGPSLRTKSAIQRGSGG